MRRCDVVHERDLRPHDAGQVGDVAGLARTHFIDRILRVFGRIEHGERQADLVVAVAGIRVCAAHSIGACTFEDAEQQGLDAGLAVASGQRDHGCRTTLLRTCSDFTQRLFGIAAQQLRQVGIDRMADQQSARAARDRFVEVIVRIVVLAAQRHEQHAAAVVRLEFAGVDGDRVDAQVGGIGLAEQPRFAPARDVAECERPHGACSNARRACAMSSNGRCTPPASW